MQEAFRRLLVIAPHCDDETYGCGGLLSRFASEGADTRVVVVACAEQTYHHHLGRVVDHHERLRELNEAMMVLKVGSADVLFPGTDATSVPMRSIIGKLDNEIRNFMPTSVLYPTMSHHQDHIVAHQASEAALRPSKATLAIQFTGMYEYMMS